MDIIVNHTAKPVVLMLGAYEPTIWNISWTPHTKIVAVMLSGYYKQVVAGISKTTEVLISTDENKGKCGIFYVTSSRLGSLNPIARQIFKREINMVHFVKHGQVVVGELLPENAKLTQSPLVKPEHYRRVELSGVTGLEQAVSRGVLRKATLDDARLWVDTISKEKAPTKDFPPVANQGVIRPKRPLLINAYVVLGPFTYPGGLFGGNSAVFFIPKGVPTPKGHPGHSSIYNFNTLSCTGAVCNR